MKFRFGKKRINNLVGFDNILPEILNEFHLEKSFTIEIIKEKWPFLVGDIISTHSVPDRIFKHTLFIAVDHSIYGQEIMMMKDTIVNKVQEELLVRHVHNIKIEVKKIQWNVKEISTNKPGGER